MAVRVVQAIIKRGDSVLLVKQQDADHPTPNWTAPAGVVREDEDLIAGLRREVLEETGLRVDSIDRLVFVTELEHHPFGIIVALTFEVTVEEGPIQPDDPDGFILEARYVPVHQAIDLISETLPWAAMSEPLLAYLRGEAGECPFWLFRRGNDDQDMLLVRVPQ